MFSALPEFLLVVTVVEESLTYNRYYGNQRRRKALGLLWFIWFVAGTKSLISVLCRNHSMFFRKKMNIWLLCFMGMNVGTVIEQFSEMADKELKLWSGYITTTNDEISSEKEGSCHQRGNDRWNHEIACVPQLGLKKESAENELPQQWCLFCGQR